MKLIDKDALVAEIKRRVTEGEKVVKEIPSSAIMGLIQAYKSTLSFIDSMQLEEIPPKLPLISQKKCMYTKDDFTDEDRKVLCDGCEEDCKYAQKEEPVSEDLENAAIKYAQDKYMPVQTSQAFKAGAKWQKQQDQSIIELAEDHAYFAGRTKTIDEIKEALLSEVLPCFMHGGEADEVVAKLDEVLNQK